MIAASIQTQWGDATARRRSTMLVAASLGVCSQPRNRCCFSDQKDPSFGGWCTCSGLPGSDLLFRCRGVLKCRVEGMMDVCWGRRARARPGVRAQGACAAHACWDRRMRSREYAAPAGREAAFTPGALRLCAAGPVMSVVSLCKFLHPSGHGSRTGLQSQTDVCCDHVRSFWSPPTPTHFPSCFLFAKLQLVNRLEVFGTTPHKTHSKGQGYLPIHTATVISSLSTHATFVASVMSHSRFTHVTSQYRHLSRGP